MPHVDEGALHAYLDGALDEYPTAEAERVREHLETCGVCRERLGQEQRIRDRAASILGSAAPEVDVPTLEELRGYVRATTPQRGTVSARLSRLGWAASVVLALGAGWMLRGGGMAPASSEGGRVLSESSAVAEEATPSGGAEPEVNTPIGSAGEAIPSVPSQELRQEPTRSRPSAVREEQVVSDAPVFGDADVALRSAISPSSESIDESLRLDELISADVLRTPIEPSVSRVGEPEFVAAASTLQPAVRVPVSDVADSGGAAPGGQRSSVDRGVVTSANVVAPSAGIASLGRAGDLGDPGAARDDEVAEEDEPSSLVVPGLEVLDVRFRGSGVRPEGQIVLQRLVSGSTLTVIHLPPEIDPSTLDAPASGHRQIMVQRSAGWIVMRAPVSEAALLELMEQLLTGR